MSLATKLTRKLMGLRWRECSSLSNGFEWIVDGLEDGSLAQEKFVRQCEQTGAHALAQLGDERNARGDQELLSQWLRKLALVAKELSEELLGQFGNKAPIIDVAWRQAEGQYLALIIDDQVQLEPVEPADRNLAAGSAPGTHLMPVEASALANRKRRRVDEADPGAATQLGMQRGHPWDQNRGHQLNKALRAHQTGKRVVQMAPDVLGGIYLEGPGVGPMEKNHKSHHARSDATGLHANAAVGPSRSSHFASLAKIATKNPPPNERVRVYSLVEPAFGEALVFFCALSYQERFLIPNSRYRYF